MSKKCYIEKCHMKQQDCDCELVEGPESCSSWVEKPLTIDSESGANVPLDRLVMPARVTEGTNFYQMEFNDGGMYSQRKYVREATDSPLSFKEIIIIKLCETILEKQA